MIRGDPVRTHFLGTLALLGNIACWSVMPVLLKVLAGSIDAWTANGLRYPFSALFYWPLLFVAWRRGAIPRGFMKKLWIPFLCSLTAQIFWALSPYYLPASSIAFLVRHSIVWAVVGSIILFPDERGLLRSGSFISGFLLAVAGFIFFSLEGLGQPLTKIGVVFMALCSAGYGLYAVSVRKCLQDVHPVIGFGAVCQLVALSTFVMMSVVRIERGDPLLPTLDGSTWALVAISSLIGIGVAHLLYFLAIQSLGAAISASSHLSGPFITYAFAAWLIGETLTTDKWIPGCLMLLGGGLIIFAQTAIGRERGRLARLSHSEEPPPSAES